MNIYWIFLLQNKIIFFRNLGIENWSVTVNKMNHFTQVRNFYTFDEIWFVEHYPIFTQRQIQGNKNIICHNEIPIANTDRGGQITYHGPGQQILYFLIDLNRRNISIRQLIDKMHKIVIKTLSHFSIKSYTKEKYPGVYVDKKKICSLGLRIKKGSTLHGLALNVSMDLKPFNLIHPCGDINIKMTQIKDFNSNIKLKDIQVILIEKLSECLGVVMMKITDKKFY